MRTTALIGLAALVAGAFSASAQIYSQNIVGYYNAPTPYSVNALCISLKTGNNRADQVVPYSDTDNIQVWNAPPAAPGWTTYIMDSGASTGWSDGGSDIALTDLPILSLGKGFIYGNNTGKQAVTVVGEVALGTTSITVPGGDQFVGSMVPFAGLISTGPVNLQIQDNDNVQFWSGSFTTGWITAIRDSGASTGWTDGGSDIPEPQVTIGQGFFIGNNSGSFSWSQTLNP